MSVRVMGNKGRLPGRARAAIRHGPSAAIGGVATAALRKEGLALQPGQWISLGAFFTWRSRTQSGWKSDGCIPIGLTGMRPVRGPFSVTNRPFDRFRLGGMRTGHLLPVSSHSVSSSGSAS